MKNKILIIIPAYNEEDTISSLLNRIKSDYPQLDILVIDDGSRDGTSDVLRELGIPHVSLISNLGYGGALETGYKYALQNKYDAVIQIDGDGQHDPRNISDFIAEFEMGDCDVILGSRFLEADSYNPHLVKKIGMKMFSFITWLATGKKFTDPTTGYQLLDCKVLQYFITNDLFPQDYPDADILILLCYSGFNIKEIPVRMYKNETKKSMHTGLKPFYYVLKMLISILVIILSRKELRSANL